MEIKIENLRKYRIEDKIFATNHAAERFDYPYPSCLVLGKNLRGEEIHAVLSDEGTSSRIITAYFPDADKWSADFRVRR
ncbi:MAG: DUF4258 domain-containing protein [Selenomonadaceae bacterium]|nr:DUF4258 domain-containing protein [Selenomonadaceae bacterium]